MRFDSTFPERYRTRPLPRLLAGLTRPALQGVATLVAVTLALAATSGAATGVVPGTFVWHDLVTDNPTGARKFYAELFGWTFEPGKGIEPDYTIIKHKGFPIGGMVVPRQQTSPQWLSYVVVADVDKAVEAFRQAGGQLYRGPLNARSDLRVAAVADPQGAPIGLASRGPLDGLSDALPDVHRWLWMDYVARDEMPALDFYSKVLGYQSQAETRETVTYYRLSNGRPRAGLFKTPWPRETSIWLPYVRVADPEASAKRAQELGGLIVQAPAQRVRNGSLAIVLDPGGAPIALQKYPF